MTARSVKEVATPRGFEFVVDRKVPVVKLARIDVAKGEASNFGLRSYFVIKRDKLVECKNLSRCLSSHSTLESFFSERTRLKIIGSHRRRQEEAQAQKRNQLMSNERYNLSIQAVYLKLCSFPVTFPCGTTLFW